jgi:hypothetical protein
VHAPGHCKADRATVSFDCASSRPGLCCLLLLASTCSPCSTASTCATPVTLIRCLNIKGRCQAPFHPASIPPRSASVLPLFCTPRHPSSRRLHRCRVLFSAPSITVRERPVVDSSHPQVSTLTGPKPTPSAFCCEHLNAASRFRPPSKPDVAATSFASSMCTLSTHHPRRRPPGSTPHQCPYSTDVHHRGAARPMSLMSPFPLKSVYRPSFMPETSLPHRPA